MYNYICEEKCNKVNEDILQAGTFNVYLNTYFGFFVMFFFTGIINDYLINDNGIIKISSN